MMMLQWGHHFLEVGSEEGLLKIWAFYFTGENLWSCHCLQFASWA